MRVISSILLIVTIISCSKHEEAIDEVKHPNLILTVDGVKSIRSSLGGFPLFDKSVEKIRFEVDTEIDNGINIGQSSKI